MTQQKPEPERPANDMDQWYIRCPNCLLVGPASSAQHAITGRPLRGTIDWQSRVTVGCIACGVKHVIDPQDLLPDDSRHVCTRCTHTTAVSSDAAEVICLHCHLYAQGPASRTNPAVAAALKAAEQKHALKLRDTLVHAKQRQQASGSPKHLTRSCVCNSCELTLP